MEEINWHRIACVNANSLVAVEASLNMALTSSLHALAQTVTVFLPAGRVGSPLSESGW